MDYLTTSQAAELYELSTDTIRWYVRLGRLPAVKFGGSRDWLIRKSDANRILKNRRPVGAPRKTA